MDSNNHNLEFSEVENMNLNSVCCDQKKGTIAVRESIYLGQEPLGDRLMAVSAVVVEGALGFFLTLLAGWPIALAAGIFPVMVNLVLAKVQSDRFDVPEAAERLANGYEPDLHPDEIPALEALTIVRLEAEIDYVSNPSPQGNIRNATQASAIAQMNFAKLIGKKIEGRGVELVTQRERIHHQDLEAVPKRVPTPTVNVAKLTQNQAKNAKKKWRQDWIKTEIERHEQRRIADLTAIQAEVGLAISYWQEIYSQGLQEYHNAGEGGDEVS
jgi:hypothetical protein